MVRVTLSSFIPSSVPASGWIVGYRVKGTTGAYLTPIGSPFSALPIIFTTTDPAGTLYEGFIRCDCTSRVSTDYMWTTPCTCTDGTYTQNVNNTGCIKSDSVSPTITHLGYCLATSQNGAFSNFGSRIYNLGFNLSTLMLPAGSVDPFINANMPSFSQWSNTGASSIIGPMNREGVWVDSDCNGTKDPSGAIGVITILTSGSGYANGSYSGVAMLGGSGTGATANFIVAGGVVTIVNEANPGTGYLPNDSISVSNASIGGGTGFTMKVGTLGFVYTTTLASTYNNAGVARTVYVGVAGADQFKLVVNGNIIVDTGSTVSTLQYKIWHIIPVVIVPGINYFNLVVPGDGTNDAMAMVVYDNTATQIFSAATDSDLNIIFKSSTLRGTTYDTSTCGAGYSLDMSGGSTHYTCTRVLTKVCNSAT